MSEIDAAEDRYDWRALQERWLPVWDDLDQFRVGYAEGKPKKYILDMFPYPSGDLHMGHAEAFAIGDVVARFEMLKGFDVLHPMGWDSFGLPAENAAIRRNLHPAQWTYSNIDVQADSFRRYAVAVDWSTRLHTSDPEYYRWTQWLFLRLFERGLAYQKDSWVNWCPKDQTVLANEQVVAGRCERCGSTVTKRSLNQWYFKITDYAQRLLDDMTQLEGRWPSSVLNMQRNWIGRSEGAEIDFVIEGRSEPVTIFTTRPDTIHGATFFVVAADSDLATELCVPEQRAEFEEYVEAVKKLTDIDRQSTGRTASGVYLGRTAINPVTGESIPVWAADYVLPDYGTGAIMAVPAHDQRDLDFALAFGLPVRRVYDEGDADPSSTGLAVTGGGSTLTNSGDLDGLTKIEAIERVTAWIDAQGLGRATVNFRLRDWLLSRQRFWGCPIPIIHCADCGAVPVPDDQLPVVLPDLRGSQLAPQGVSPLATVPEWVNVECPRCGGPGRRDTDTMDTFVDSSWYYLRYLSPDFTDGPFDPAAAREWMPVDTYIGGSEHAILHLLYSRFVTKVLHDLGMVDFVEPFTSLLNQGQVILNGAGMSKSTGNLVDLGEELTTYGVDAIRLTMLFAGPPEDDIDWATVSAAGSGKFLARAWRVCAEIGAGEPDPGAGDIEVRQAVARAVREITELLEGRRFNVAIARLMTLTSVLRKAVDGEVGASDAGVRRGAEALATMLSLFAPYCAEDCWQRLGHDVAGGDMVGRSAWPLSEENLNVDERVTCVLQINGKVRDRLQVRPDVLGDDLEQQALAAPRIQELLGGAKPARIIVRAPKLVNIIAPASERPGGTTGPGEDAHT